MINRDNYEEVMFGMIEGLYSEAELHQLSQQIAADPFLAAEWSHWATTQLQDDLSDYTPAAAEWADRYLANKKAVSILGSRYARRAGRVAAAVALFVGCWCLLPESPAPPANRYPLTDRTSAPTVKPTADPPARPSPSTEQPVHRPATVAIASTHTASDKYVSVATVPETEQQPPFPQPADNTSMSTDQVAAAEPQASLTERAQAMETPLFTVSIHTQVVPTAPRKNRQAKDLLTNSRLQLTTTPSEEGLQLRLQGANHATLELPLQKEIHN